MSASPTTDPEGVETLADALGVIRDEYGGSYGEWCRFGNDAEVHADAAGYDLNWREPSVHFPVVRYRLDAETITNTPEIGDEHVEHLIAFARAGCPDAHGGSA